MNCTHQIPLLRSSLVAVVDDEDFDRLSNIRWSALVTRADRDPVYARGHVPGAGVVRMHRFILSAVPGQIVDHINGDGLDNRRINLRICTVAENARNRSGKRHRECPFKGVARIRSQRWLARIKVDGRDIYLGTFDEPEAAARAYDAAASKHFGEFAKLNFAEARP